jgi:hypothetical protein
VLLAQHEGEIGQLALTGDGRVLSTGDDATLFATDLSVEKPCGIFIGNLTFKPLAYDVAHHVIVVGDASGSVHILPLAPPSGTPVSSLSIPLL